MSKIMVEKFHFPICVIPGNFIMLRNKNDSFIIAIALQLFYCIIYDRIRIDFGIMI
jgi:hypothetical protein